MAETGTLDHATAQQRNAATAIALATAAGYEAWMSYDCDQPELWGARADQHSPVARTHPQTLAYLDAQGD